jgi:hypothetical protein
MCGTPSAANLELRSALEDNPLALKPCRECGNQVATDAKACPHCGKEWPAGKPTTISGVLGLGCIGFLVVAVILTALSGNEDASVASPDERRVSAGPPAPPPPPPASPASLWSIDSSTSAMDDSPTVVLSRDAENSVSAWLETKTPTMIIRCREGRVQLYMHLGSAFDTEIGHLDEARIRYRIDSLPAQTSWWTESTDNDAVFAPSPVSLARRLARGSTLTMQFTPFNADPVTARFDIRGLDELLPRVLRACKVL